MKNFCEDLFFFFFGEHLPLVSLVLGLGLEHSCPWPRECLSSERLSLALALASDFFCVLGLGLGLEPCVLDSTSAIDVADHWQSHYESILNSSAQAGLTDNLFVQSAIGNSSSFHNIPNLLCTVDLEHILLYKLPLDFSPEADTITAEHLCYCDPSICLYFSIFLNMCLIIILFLLVV